MIKTETIKTAGLMLAACTVLVMLLGYRAQARENIGTYRSDLFVVEGFEMRCAVYESPAGASIGCVPGTHSGEWRRVDRPQTSQEKSPPRK
jgi:hypothetical protein